MNQFTIFANASLLNVGAYEGKTDQHFFISNSFTHKKNHMAYKSTSDQRGSLKDNRKSLIQNSVAA